MTTREKVITLKGVSALSYKLNSETTGFCKPRQFDCSRARLTIWSQIDRVAYSAERLAKLGNEAGKKCSAFSTSDR